MKEDRSLLPSASQGNPLGEVLEGAVRILDRIALQTRAELTLEEVGEVVFVAHGIARVNGLPGVRAQELVRFGSGQMGMAFNLDPEEVGVILLDSDEDLSAGSTVYRTGRVLDVPVGSSLLGRVVDSLGRPLDERGPIGASTRLPIEREAPPIMHRDPVTVPVQTGVKVIDALIPIGRGQRQLILGDRQTGKTALAIQAILNQWDQGMYCIYCAVGQRGSAVARVIADLRDRGAMDYTLVVCATENDPPGLQFIAPYAAMSMAEHLMSEGADVLLVLDDLTRHARAYRELSLLLRRPPGREAFPGDIFYIHSRLLERSTHLRAAHGGGSVTTLPVIETEAQNLSAYIPTNLISITDGQVYLSPDLFQKGVLPAVDVGQSVSRVGGKTQRVAYRAIAGDLRLAYSQFEELEAFARFGTRLDAPSRRILDRGRRVRELLKQGPYETLTAPEQIAVLTALNAGVFDEVPLTHVRQIERTIAAAVVRELPQVCEDILSSKSLSEEAREAIVRVAQTACNKGAIHADPDEPQAKDHNR